MFSSSGIGPYLDTIKTQFIVHIQGKYWGALYFSCCVFYFGLSSSCCYRGRRPYAPIFSCSTLLSTPVVPADLPLVLSRQHQRADLAPWCSFCVCIRPNMSRENRLRHRQILFLCSFQNRSKAHQMPVGEGIPQAFSPSRAQHTGRGQSQFTVVFLTPNGLQCGL